MKRKTLRTLYTMFEGVIVVCTIVLAVAGWCAVLLFLAAMFGVMP